MSAMPSESFTPAGAFGKGPVPARSTAAPGADAALAERWSVIHESARVVAALGGIRLEPWPVAVRGFPLAIARAGGQRRSVAVRGMDDLSAILEVGIRALLTLHGQGGSPPAAAEALWAEFVGARDALLALAPPECRVLG